MEPDRSSIQSPSERSPHWSMCNTNFNQMNKKKKKKKQFAVLFCYILAWHWNVFIYTHDNVKTTTPCAILYWTLSVAVLYSAVMTAWAFSFVESEQTTWGSCGTGEHRGLPKFELWTPWFHLICLDHVRDKHQVVPDHRKWETNR